MHLQSTVHETEDLFAAKELFHGRGWTNGLPVVPPTEAAVRGCLDGAALAPDHVIGVEPVRARAITAEKVAVNAVMAGCLPAHFPIVVTALAAMLREEFTLHGATASTGGCAIHPARSVPAPSISRNRSPRLHAERPIPTGGGGAPVRGDTPEDGARYPLDGLRAYMGRARCR